MPDQPRLESTAFLQESIRTQHLDKEQKRVQRLENDARSCSHLFVPLIHILVFTLVPALAHQLASQRDPSYIPIKHPPRDICLRVQRYLVTLATTPDASTVPPLELPFHITRLQFWRDWAESTLAVEVPVASLHFGSMTVAKTEYFLRCSRVSLPSPNVQYWYDILLLKLPLLCFRAVRRCYWKRKRGPRRTIRGTF
jgi:hypothetical protein